MATTTKLSNKMRVLAKHQPKRAEGLRMHADRLDRAMFAGTVTHNSLTFRQAKLAYMEASGRSFSYMLHTDLDAVERTAD